MNLSERERVVSFYEKELEKYGYDARSLHWSSRWSQRVRFHVLTQVGNMDHSTIADIGCGLGDLYGYLLEIAQGFRYVGYDISPRMVEASQTRFKDGNFLVRDILSEGLGETFDYVMASGTFNIRIEEHDRFVREMIAAMYEGCRKATAFNLLAPSGYPDLYDDFYYGTDPQEMVRFCQSLCQDVVLKEGYLPLDFTIYMHKER